MAKLLARYRGLAAGRDSGLCWAGIAVAAFAAFAAFAMAACSGADRVELGKSENRLRLCEEFLRNKQLEPAAAECDKALAHDKCNEQAHNAHGLIDLMYANKTSQILEVDDCLTGVDAEGLRAELDQQLAAADAHLLDAIACAPDYGEAYQNRCVVATLLGDYQGAVDRCTLALANTVRLGSSALTHANLGWAYFHLDQYPKAAAELRRAVGFQPNECLWEYRLGRVYFVRKEWEKAVRQFEKTVLELNCPIQEAPYFLMLTYRELGLDARKLLDRCLAMGPQSCVAAKCRSLVP